MKATAGVRSANQQQSVADFLGNDGPTDGTFIGNIDGAHYVYGPDTPLSDIPPFTPTEDGAAPTGAQIIYVNGILTPAEAEADACQNLANATGANVIALHNATTDAPDGLNAIADLLQCAGDKGSELLQSLGIPYSNAATETLTSTIEDAIQNGEDINVFGHSQGGLIVSSALNEVRDDLVDSYMSDPDNPMSQAEAESQAADDLSLVHVQTFGAAAYSYPDGPTYDHWVNVADPVPDWFGVGSELPNTALDPFSEEIKAQISQFLGETYSGSIPDTEYVQGDNVTIHTFDQPVPWYTTDDDGNPSFDIGRAHDTQIYFDHLADDPAALDSIYNPANDPTDVTAGVRDGLEPATFVDQAPQSSAGETGAAAPESGDDRGSNSPGSTSSGDALQQPATESASDSPAQSPIDQLSQITDSLPADIAGPFQQALQNMQQALVSPSDYPDGLSDVAGALNQMSTLMNSVPDGSGASQYQSGSADTPGYDFSQFTNGDAQAGSDLAQAAQAMAMVMTMAQGTMTPDAYAANLDTVYSVCQSWSGISDGGEDITRSIAHRPTVPDHRLTAGGHRRTVPAGSPEHATSIGVAFGLSGWSLRRRWSVEPDVYLDEQRSRWIGSEPISIWIG